MAARPTAITVSPTLGGQLVASLSLESVGPHNYAEKVNFRRKDEREIRREGWILFRPNEVLPQGLQATPLTDGTTTFPGPIVSIAECVRPNQERAIFAATKTEVFKFNFTTGVWSVVMSGLHPGKRWQIIPLNGYLVWNNGVDLPFTTRVEEPTGFPIYELRELGVAAVGFIEEINGIIQAYDITEVKADRLATWMNGADPYGIVDPTLTNRIQFRCIWGEIGQPRHWAPVFQLSQPASSATIILPFPSTVFVAGVTRVAVINGGPNGGVLGGDTLHPDGILVTAVSGATLTLEIPTDVNLSYPRDIEVLRWEDQSSLVGRYDLQDDASEIVAVKKLAFRVMVYRKSSIFRSTYLGNLDQPFEFRRVVGTNNVPVWGDAIAEVNGEYHLYPGEGNRIYHFDGTNEPFIHKICDVARTLLFNGLTAASDVYAVTNAITHEVWFVRPGLVFAFDLDKNTVSTVDVGFNACCYIRRPGSPDRWFVLAIDDTIYTYGLVESALAPLKTFLRNGLPAGGRIRGGLVHWNDRYNEKDLSSYIIHLASGTNPPALELNLFATFDEREPPVQVLNEPFTGPTYKVDTLYRAIFFQDEILIADLTDVDIQVTARTFDRAPVRSQSTPRNTHV